MQDKKKQVFDIILISVIGIWISLILWLYVVDHDVVSVERVNGFIFLYSWLKEIILRYGVTIRVIIINFRYYLLIIFIVVWDIVDIIVRELWCGVSVKCIIHIYGHNYALFESQNVWPFLSWIKPLSFQASENWN